MKRHKFNSGIFIIIIPICILILAFIFDNSFQFIENKRLEIVTKEIIKDSLTINVNDYYEKVKKDYENKNITTDLLQVEYNEGILFIYNSHTFTSFFGKLFNISSYRAEISIEGHLEDDEVIFKEVDYE